MALASSGQISMSQINAEFGRGNSLSNYRGTSNGKGSNFPSDQISFSNFFGAIKAFSLTRSLTSTVNYNLYNDLINNGWDGSRIVEAVITVEYNNVVYASDNQTPAFNIDGIPSGSFVKVINNGWIVGKGGRGIGRLNSWDNVGAVTAGTLTAPAFSSGGPALRTTFSPTLIDNANGVIGGGGGAGGAGGAAGCDCKCSGCGGIGCGGYGVSGGAGGYGDSGYGWQGFQSAPQFNIGGYQSFDIHTWSNSGGVYDAGAGVGYSPGASGSLGVNGSRGGGGAGCGIWWLGPSDPGWAGACIYGNWNINWLNSGTRYGVLS